MQFMVEQAVMTLLQCPMIRHGVSLHYVVSVATFLLKRNNGFILQVRQYKHERECNAVIQQSREEKIVRLEALMGGVLPRETFLNEEWAALLNEHKV